jgi:hypothetical protein
MITANEVKKITYEAKLDRLKSECCHLLTKVEKEITRIAYLGESKVYLDFAVSKKDWPAIESMIHYLEDMGYSLHYSESCATMAHIPPGETLLVTFIINWDN